MPLRPAVLALPILLSGALPVAAQPAGAEGGPWQVRGLAGYLHQLETDVDDGSDLTVDRAFAQVGAYYGFDRRTSAGLRLGYRFDAFDFGGDGALTGFGPWSDIQELRLSAPVRFGIGERIDAFVTPQVAWSAETGAGFGDAMSGGALGGAAYTFSDRLRLGAGLGVLSEIEGDFSVFPILLIDWQVTDTIAITTTPSVGITRGPSLNANWTPLDAWTFTLGGGYESYRFRLDTEDRVGEETSFPVFVAATYRPIRSFDASLVGGAFFGGELRLEDDEGDLIAKEDYDPAPFVGFTVSGRF